MDLELNGKVAIIGGASRGLGRACAEVLAEEGARVAMCARTPGPLEQAADEIRAATGADIFTYAGDLDNEETIAELVAGAASHFGQIDIMVNNSGGPPQAYAKDSTEELWQVSANRSLFFFARMTREALPHLRAQGGGRIINILASTVYTPIPNLALSAATRMGVIGFMKNLADDLGHENILINNVCPGSIMSDRMMENVEDRARTQGIPLEDALAQRAEQTALKRIGEPRELAYLVAFLASSRSSYITGTTMLVDGGLVRSVM